MMKNKTKLTQIMQNTDTEQAVSVSKNKAGKSHQKRMRPQSQRFALEQRIVFDAVLPALTADAIDQHTQTSHASDTPSVTDQSITNINESTLGGEQATERAKQPQPAENTTQETADTSDKAITAPSERSLNERSLIDGTLAPSNLTSKEIIFIDAVVSDLQQYITDHPNADVVLLDSNKDALDQIAAVLNGRTGIEAIHILSHGSSGELAIGNGVLNIENLLSTEHAEDLATIRNALTADADILIYGCNVAEGSKGVAFINALATATGADIAASDDTTGSAALGADWDLEAQTGEVQSFALAAQAWLGTLDNITKAQEFTGLGMDFVVIGNSELTQTTIDGKVAFKAAVTPGTATSASLTTTLLPTTKSIEAVYLYWYGISADTAPPNTPLPVFGAGGAVTIAEAAKDVDTTAVFTLADNSTVTVTADKLFTETNTAGTRTYQGRRADVTELVLNQPGLLTGTYKLDITGGIYENAKTNTKDLLGLTQTVDGVVGTADPIRAWQMVIVYSDAAATTAGTVQIYDGLDLVQTTAEPAIPLSGFKVPTTDLTGRLAITTLGGDTVGNETLVTSTTFPDMASGFANGTSSGTGQGVTVTSAAFEVDVLAGSNPANTTSMNLTASQGSIADRYFIGTAILKIAAQPPSVDLNGPATGVGFTNTITDDAAGTSALVSASRDVNDFGENDITTFKISVGGVLNGASEKITLNNGSGTVIDIPLNAALAGTPTITISGVTFKLAFDGSVLTITNNAGATTPMGPVALEALMSAITYSNTAFTTRTGGDRIFNFLAIDNAGLESKSAAAIITVPPPPADADGDLVPDAADIDDDNDGILDTAEQVPVTLSKFDPIPVGTYPGLASNQGLRISDTTGQYFVDIYLGPRSSSGAPVVFDIANKTIGSVDSNVDSNEVVELIYSTDKSPRKFELSSLNINNILSLTAPLNATGVRDAYAFSAPGTWTPIGTPAGAVVTVNTANADAVGAIKINDPDGNNVLNNIGKFTQVTALDATISDVLLNMTGVTENHNVRFDFEAGQVTTSMFLFNSGGGNMFWRFAPAMTVLVPRDSDNDGAPDQADLDSDNDGISDLYESTGGTGDALADANKDGTISLAEGGGDADKDGLMDIFDASTTSKSGLTSLGNAPIDTDGDTVKDFVDLDSDGDGIADTIEARPTAGYVPNDGATASPSLDKDGVLGYFDNTNAVGGAFGGNFIDPVNTDGTALGGSDATPDYLDTDSDGDLKLDSAESGLPAATTDANKDGIADSIPGVSYSNPDGTTLPAAFANEIGDTTQVAYREVLDTDGDGIGDAQDLDDDNDGILDTIEVAAPILLQTFGAGTGRASFATAGLTATTTYIYNGTSNVQDGQYALASSVVGLGEWFANPINFNPPNQDVTFKDNTGDPNGRFLAVNAAFGAGEFYRDTVNVTQAGNYDLSIFAANANTGSIKPNITLNIINSSNVTVGSLSTGDLPNYTTAATAWRKFDLFADLAVGTYTITIVNNAPGGAGNDLFIDDISLRLNPDADGDGVFNSKDLDSDNDGISDLYESTGGKGDALADSNKDGTVSLAESIAAGATGDGDIDNDGLMDIFDANTANNTGTASLGNTPINTDGDSKADYLDLDSDADGIADTIEARLTAGYVPNDGVTASPDTDKDGILGYFDNTNAVGGAFGGNFIDPVNTDGSFAAGSDTTPDYLDLDSDGDGKSDSLESGFTLSTPVVDANQDGIADSVPGVSYANPDGNVTNPQTNLANEIGNTTEVAYREFLDTDNDGVNDLLDLDDDNDGILDTVEESTVINGVLDASSAVVTPNGTTSAVVSNLLFGTVTASLSVNTINGSGFPTRINQIDVSAASSDFTSALFTPALGNPGSVNTNVNLRNDAAARVTYTLTLSQPVDNLVMHVALIEGARWQFTGSQHTESKVSGNASLTYTTATRLLDNTNNTLFNTNGFASIRLTSTGTSGITVIQWEQLDDPNNTAGTADTDTFTFSFTQTISDTDGDGVNNSKDLDSDNDGISDLFESTGGAGVALKDTNNDGTITLAESVAGGATGDGDIDNDGLMDIFDADTTSASKTTGATSKGTTPINTDGDSKADYLDLDSDGDGIADSIEARPTAGYTSYTGTVDTNDDLDNDGVVDIFDQSNAVGGTFGGNFIAPVNTDALIANNADTKPDYLDTDSDGDGKLDSTESGLSAVTTDANNDGIRDSVSASYANPDGAVTTTPTTVLANEVGTTAEVGYREFNQPPVAVTDVISVVEDTPTVINLLANDTDPNGDTLSLKSINGVAIVAGTLQTITVPNGTVTVSTTGVVTFTPAANYNGPVTFPYEVKDPGGLFAAGTVNINVTPVNDTPVLVADTKTVIEDSGSNTGNVLTNDSDIDGNTLRVTQFVVNGTTFTVPNDATGTLTTIAGVGLFNMKADGTYTFFPNTNFNGAVPTVTYTVDDGSGAGNATATSTLNITVTPVNDPPVAVDDTVNATEDTPIVLPLLTNDTDVDNINAQLTYKSINGVAVTGAAQTIAVPNGSVSITAAGVVTFTPNANFNGTVTFPYEVKDPSGLSSQATATIIVAAVNDAPVAADDSATVNAGATITGNVLTNDSDIESPASSLTVTGFSIAGEAGPFVVGTPYSITNKGTITINADGSYTFVADVGASGAVPAITYAMSDGNGGTDTADLNIQISFVNQPAVLSDVTYTTNEDTDFSGIDLIGAIGPGLISDPDSNFDGVIFTALPPASQGVLYLNSIDGVSPPTPVQAGVAIDLATYNLALAINAGAVFTFVPAPDFNGTVTIPYTVTEAGVQNTSTANIVIDVLPDNDAPVAADDNLTINEDTPTVLNLLGNDTDIDNPNSDLSIKSINGITIIAGTAQSINVPNGVVTVSTTGVVTFTPDANYSGPASFDYVVQDTDGLTDTGRVNITVNAVNDAPVAVADTRFNSEDSTATGNVLLNDSDIEGNPLTVTQFVVDGQTITVPAGGKGTVTLASGVLEIGSNGAYTFTPIKDFNGAVPTITYTVNDGTGTINATATSTLNITITPLNDAPVAVNDIISVAEDSPTGINIIANDTDIDNTNAQLIIKSINGTNITPGVAQSITVPHGVVDVSATGALLFRPDPNYNGPANFKYVVQDPGGLTSQGTAIITVTQVNDAPIATPDIATTPEDTVTTGNLIANDTDIDGDTLSVTQFVVAGQTIAIPTGGSDTLTLPSGRLTIDSNGGYTFTPAPNFNGPVPQITYTVSDGTTTRTSTLDITVTPVNDAPVAVDDSVSVSEDATTTLTLLTNDTDAEGDTLTLKSINGTTITPGVAQAINVPNGTVNITATGVISFTPTPDYNGPATFDYVVQDSLGEEDTGTVNITVTPANDSPVVTPETASTPEDTVTTGNLLTNDSDIDGNTLTITQFVVNGQTVTVPAGGKGTAILASGVLDISSNGTYTFTPAANFNGAVPQVTYTVSDGSGTANATATSTLDLTVTPVNDAPVATPTGATGAEDATSIPLSLAGTDIDGTIARVTVTTLPSAIQGKLQKADGTAVKKGDPLTPAEAAGLVFIPAADFNGTVNIDFTVTDNLGLDSSPASATITVTPVNDKPVATNKSVNTIEGNNGVAIDVNLSGTDIEDGVAPTVTVTSLPDPSEGVLFFADGVTPVVAGVPMTAAVAATLKFKADQDFAGILTIPFTVTDSGNDSTLTGGTPLTSAPGSFVIDVQNVNDAPVVPNKTGSGLEDTPLSITNLISGVTDADIGDSVKSATINNLPPASQGVLYYTNASGVKTPVVAGISIPSALIGSLVFEPAPNFNGTVDTIKFVVADQAGELSTPADLVITIAPVNDRPVVAPDVQLVDEDTVATGNVLNNDSDIENNPLTVTQFVVAGQTITIPPLGSGTATITGVGQLIINANGTYTFTPVNNFNGSVPSVTYTVSDGQVANPTSTSTLNIGIGSLNDAPIATPTTLTGTEDTNLPVNLTGTDTDGTVDSVTVTKLPPASEGVLQKADGSLVTTGVPLTLAEAASLVFVPASNFNGTVTPIEFIVTDNQGLDSAVATSSLTVSPVNDAPIATADAISTNEDTPVSIALTGTDIEDGVAPNVTVTALPPIAQGVLYFPNGVTPVAANTPIPAAAAALLVFKPATNFSGTVTIPFTVTDSGIDSTVTSTPLVSSPANFVITVNAVNDAPIATTLTASGNEDTPITVSLAGTDVDGTIASVKVTALPDAAQGILYLADGTTPVVANSPLTPAQATGLIFKPAANFNGPVAAITFTVTDNQGLESSPANANINVTAVNDAPLATPITPSGNEDTPIQVSLAGTDIEDGIAPTVTVTALPPASKGVLYKADGTTPVAANTLLTAAEASGLIFKPAPNYNTAVDGPVVIPFTVTDSNGLVSSPANASITVNAVNDAPIATAISPSGNEDTPIPVSLAGTDLDGTITAVNITALPPASQGTLFKADGVTPVAAGDILTPAEAAGLIFKPALNFTGTVDPISFTVTDNQGTISSPADATVNVQPVNDAPVASPVNASGNEDNAIPIILAGSDIEDGTAPTVTVTALPPATKGILYKADGTTPVAPNTALTAAEAAGLIFKPAPNYNTAVDGPIVIPFTVSDSNGVTSTPSAANITIASVNDLPLAKGGSTDTPEDTPVTVKLVGFDVDGTITSVTVTVLPDPAEGILYFADGVTPVVLGAAIDPIVARTLLFVPTLNYNSTDFNLVDIQFTVTDNEGGVSTANNFVIDVGSVNDEPIATSVTASTPEDTPLKIKITATDPDVGDSVALISINTLPPASQGILYWLNGTQEVLVAIGADYPYINATTDAFIFKPAPNYNGPVDVIEFVVKDSVGQLSSAVTTMTLTVGDVNDLPTATPVITSGNEDTAITLNLTGSDIDGTITNVKVTSLPNAAQGSLFLADGVTPVVANTLLTPAQAATLKFVPAANFNGAVTPFQFTVIDDDTGESTPVDINIIVTPVNDAPIATAGSVSGDEDTDITFSLTGTDTEDVTAPTVTVTALPPASNGVLYLADGTTPVQANVPLTAAQATGLIFKPAPNYNTAVDGPIVVPFTVTDSGVDSTVSDTPLTSTSANFTITVNAVNDLPTATPVTATGNEDTPITLNLTGSDIDGTIASVTITALPPAGEGILYLADGVTAVVANTPLSPAEATGLVFIPAANFNGAITPISFTVTDNQSGVSTPANANISVTPVNDAPIATAGSVSGDEDTDITFSLAGTDTENIPADLTVTITALPPASKGVLYLADGTTPVQANVPLGASQVTGLIFKPAPNYNTVADGPIVIPFTVTDTGVDSTLIGTPLTSTPANFSITVNAVNDLPIASPTTPSGAEDTPIPVSLTGTDVEGPITSVTITALPPAGEGVLKKADGTVVNANDVLTPAEAANLIFTPAADFNGAVTPITFTVQDNSGADSPPASATITVTAVNDPPVATPASATGNEDTPITIALTGTDVDGTIASVAVTSLPPASQGVLTKPDGSPVSAGEILSPADAAALQFVPAANFNGTVSFNFTVTDSQGATSPAGTASITVNAVNDTPVANPLTVTGTEDTPVGISLTGTDVEGPIASVTVLDIPPASQGTLVKADGTPVVTGTPMTPAEAATLKFVPAKNYFGPVSPIGFIVTDNQGLSSSPAVVNIAVQDVISPPVAKSATVSGSPEKPISVKLSGTDADGTITKITIKSLPPASQGILTLADGTPVSVGQDLTPEQANSLIFKAADGFNGTGSIGFTVTDDEGLESAIGSANVKVASDDAPFEQRIPQFNTFGTSNGNALGSTTSASELPPFSPSNNPVTDGVVISVGLVAQNNSMAVFNADTPAGAEIDSYSTNLSGAGQGNYQGLFVQQAVRHLPVTNDISIYVQNAVRQSQTESLARNIGVNSLNTATNAVTSMIMPFELGAPNQIHTDFTVNGAFDNDDFKEELKKKPIDVSGINANKQEILSTLSNAPYEKSLVMSKQTRESSLSALNKAKPKSAATSFGKQLDLAAKKLKATGIFS